MYLLLLGPSAARRPFLSARSGFEPQLRFQICNDCTCAVSVSVLETWKYALLQANVAGSKRAREITIQQCMFKVSEIIRTPGRGSGLFRTQFLIKKKISWVCPTGIVFPSSGLILAQVMGVGGPTVQNSS